MKAMKSIPVHLSLGSYHKSISAPQLGAIQFPPRLSWKN